MKLRVWLRAKDLCVKVLKMTDKTSLSKDFGFKDQLRRSAISIASNIAEGDELQTEKQALRHFYIAKGSTAELYTQIIIAQELNYISDLLFKELVDDCEAISAMLYNLISVKSQQIKP